MKKEVLRLVGVSANDYSFGGLKDATFSLYEGETIAFAGLFNSGKITLERILSGDPVPYTGEIYLQGRRITQDDTACMLSSKVALISNSRRLFMNMNPHDNIFISQTGISMWASIRHHAVSEGVQALQQELEIDFSVKWMDQLTEFEKLKYEILKSYVGGVKILIFANLSMYITEKEAHSLSNIIRFLNTLGMAVIIQSDDYFSIFEDVVSRCLVVRGGVMTTILYKDENDIFDEDRMRHAIIGRAFNRRYEAIPSEPSKTGSAPCIRLIAQTNGKTLLEGRPGDIIGIFDRGDQVPKTIEGFMQYLDREVRITIDDAPFQPRKVFDFVRHGIALITTEISDRPIFLNLSPVENVCIFAQRLFGKPLIYKRSISEYLYNLVIGKHRILRHCQGLQKRKDSLGLTYEQKYELMIAKWLAFNPKIVILFTPLSNMDTKNAEYYRDWHAAMSDERKIQILISSSYESLDGICTEILSVG